jgi:hypothetical protein
MTNYPLGGEILVFMLLAISGCAMNLPFNARADYDSILKAKALPVEKNPIAVKWVPANFPERVDIKGASGFVGGGSRTRIPIGASISKRVIELLDVSCGVDQASHRILTISVIDADPDSMRNKIRTLATIQRTGGKSDEKSGKRSQGAHEEGVSLPEWRRDGRNGPGRCSQV